MSADGYFEGWQVEGRGIECCVADFAALIRAVAETHHLEEYEVCVGLEWTGDQPLQILTIDGSRFTYDVVSTPLRKFTPVRSTINAAASDESFDHDAFRLAEDCVNQGGVTHLNVIAEPPAAEA